MFTIGHALILLGTGLFVGFFGGMLGVGGGIIMIPVQYAVYINMGMPTDIAMKVALGTSLLVILPTSISGAWRHHQKKAVYWHAALVIGGVSLAASFGGATLAAHLPGSVLKMIFGIVIVLAGLRMILIKQKETEEEPVRNPWVWVAWAIPIGLTSGLLGLGGGVLAVPVMTIALRFKMHTAVATSLAMIILTSTGGVTGYIINGIGVAGVPPYSLGYVNLPSWALLAASSAGMAQVGAITAHHIPAKQLRYVFVALIFYMGLRMAGVFDLLGLPL